MPCCPPGNSVCNTQLPAARSDLDWSAATARVLFDGDGAIVCNTVRKSARRGQRQLPAAAARVLRGLTLSLVSPQRPTFYFLQSVTTGQTHDLVRWK